MSSRDHRTNPAGVQLMRPSSARSPYWSGGMSVIAVMEVASEVSASVSGGKVDGISSAGTGGVSTASILASTGVFIGDASSMGIGFVGASVRFVGYQK